VWKCNQHFSKRRAGQFWAGMHIARVNIMNVLEYYSQQKFVIKY